MKGLTVLVFCVLAATYGVESATLSQKISTAISSSLVRIKLTFATLNNTLVAQEKSALYTLTTVVTTVNKTIIPLLTKFSSYGVNTSQVANVVSGMVDQLTSAKEQLKSFDSSNITQLYDGTLQQVDSIKNMLNLAADNMATVAASSVKYGARCLTKYGAMLTSVPVSADRINKCVYNEVAKIYGLTANINNLYNLAKTYGTEVFNMAKICSPLLASTGGSACVQKFYEQFSQFASIADMPMAFMSGLSPLVQTILFRADRCGNLVIADISSLSQTYSNNFEQCLTKGY